MLLLGKKYCSCWDLNLQPGCGWLQCLPDELGSALENILTRLYLNWLRCRSDGTTGAWCRRGLDWRLLAAREGAWGVVWWFFEWICDRPGKTINMVFGLVVVVLWCDGRAGIWVVWWVCGWWRGGCLVVGLGFFFVVGGCVRTARVFWVVIPLIPYWRIKREENVLNCIE